MTRLMLFMHIPRQFARQPNFPPPKVVYLGRRSIRLHSGFETGLSHLSFEYMALWDFAWKM